MNLGAGDEAYEEIREMDLITSEMKASMKSPYMKARNSKVTQSMKRALDKLCPLTQETSKESRSLHMP